MTASIQSTIDQLIDSLAMLPTVRAVGLSGGSRPFPEPGAGDIDLFLYCRAIPTPEERRRLLAALGAAVTDITVGRISGGHWGQGDCCTLAGVETWLLYFTQAEAELELTETLAGKHPGQVGGYYPLGRCAMWQSLRALYDPDGFLASLRARLAEYPPALAQTVLAYHLSALQDVEDLERAVRRSDVFFYHFAFEPALDHYLQALFALNRTFFPSRKRSEEYLRGFARQPLNCAERLKEVIAWGGSPDTLVQSYTVWQGLVEELGQIALNGG